MSLDVADASRDGRVSLDVVGASRDACRVFKRGRGVSRRQWCLEMRQSRLETPSVSLDVVGVSRDAERVSRRGMGVLRRGGRLQTRPACLLSCYV